MQQPKQVADFVEVIVNLEAVLLQSVAMGQTISPWPRKTTWTMPEVNLPVAAALPKIPGDGLKSVLGSLSPSESDSVVVGFLCPPSPCDDELHTAVRPFCVGVFNVLLDRFCEQLKTILGQDGRHLSGSRCLFFVCVDTVFNGIV